MKNFNVGIAIDSFWSFQTADRATASAGTGCALARIRVRTTRRPHIRILRAPEGKVSVTQEIRALGKADREAQKRTLSINGTPAIHSAYIANIGSEIGYFEPILEKRLDGLEPLRKMYEVLRGRVHADKYDMLNTRVQMVGDAAILSFNLISIENGVPFRWNCTEVFAKEKDGQWKIVHSHWSVTKPRPY